MQPAARGRRATVTPVTPLAAAARAVADAVLYEGYLLYPYRASSAKNRSRWQFGVLGPPAAAPRRSARRRTWRCSACCIAGDAAATRRRGAPSTCGSCSCRRGRSQRLEPTGRTRRSTSSTSTAPAADLGRGGRAGDHRCRDRSAAGHLHDVRRSTCRAARTPRTPGRWPVVRRRWPLTAPVAVRAEADGDGWCGSPSTVTQRRTRTRPPTRTKPSAARCSARTCWSRPTARRSSRCSTRHPRRRPPPPAAASTAAGRCWPGDRATDRHAARCRRSSCTTTREIAARERGRAVRLHRDRRDPHAAGDDDDRRGEGRGPRHRPARGARSSTAATR